MVMSVFLHCSPDMGFCRWSPGPLETPSGGTGPAMLEQPQDPGSRNENLKTSKYIPNLKPGREYLHGVHITLSSDKAHRAV